MLNVSALRINIENRRMSGAVFGREVRLLTREFSLLSAQSRNRLRLQNIGDRFNAAAVRQNLLGTRILRLLFSKICAGKDQLGVQLRKLLLIERRPSGIFEAVLSAVNFCRALRVLNLRAQAREARRQPFIGFLRGIKLRFQLINDIGVGERIGNLDRLGRTFARELQRDHISRTAPCNIRVFDE